MEEVEGSVEMMLARLDELATMLEAVGSFFERNWLMYFGIFQAAHCIHSFIIFFCYSCPSDALSLLWSLFWSEVHTHRVWHSFGTPESAEKYNNAYKSDNLRCRLALFIDVMHVLISQLNIQTVEQRIELEPLLTAFASKLEQDYARIDKTAVRLPANTALQWSPMLCVAQSSVHHHYWCCGMMLPCKCILASIVISSSIQEMEHEMNVKWKCTAAYPCKAGPRILESLATW